MKATTEDVALALKGYNDAAAVYARADSDYRAVQTQRSNAQNALDKAADCLATTMVDAGITKVMEDRQKAKDAIKNRTYPAFDVPA